MKKLGFGLACVLAGCAAGAVMPHVTAQTFAPNPAAPKWDQFCERIHTDRAFAENLNASVSSKGRDGWELVGVPMLGVSGPSVALACFKRPAP